MEGQEGHRKGSKGLSNKKAECENRACCLLPPEARHTGYRNERACSFDRTFQDGRALCTFTDWKEKPEIEKSHRYVG